MNLKQMEYFVAVAEQLNFTRAARQCFVSQTAMTLQIQSLEEKVGVPLFVRDKHHVELTAAGKVYLKEARVIPVSYTHLDVYKRQDFAKRIMSSSETRQGFPLLCTMAILRNAPGWLILSSIIMMVVARQENI